VKGERLLDVADDSVEISERAPRLGGQASDAQWSVEDQGGDERSAITHDSGFFHPVLKRIRGAGSFTEREDRWWAEQGSNMLPQLCKGWWVTSLA
jgi:hypothetical protein